MTAAYERSKLGYDTPIFEARDIACAEDPGAGLRPGVASDPHAFRDLLQNSAITGFRAVADHTQKNTMFEPIDGMDQVARGFEREVGHLIQYEHVVQEIRQSDDGVRVVVENAGTGEMREVEGDFCICTIPLSVLNQIPADFSREFQTAIQAVAYEPTGKMGLQFARRFWEEDDFIYGGHSTRRDRRRNRDPIDPGRPARGLVRAS